MDAKLIQQYGEAIFSYRIRTARQKTRMQYEDFDKQLIQLRRQEIKLARQKRNLGWQILDKPYQKGWVRYFVLREDIAMTSHAKFFDDLLQKINTYKYSWRKDFKKRKRKGGKRNYVAIEQRLLKLNTWQYYKKAFTDPEKQFFIEIWETNVRQQLEKKYEFKDPDIFVLKIAPYMIDKERISAAQLESEIQLLDNYIERNNYRKRLEKILRGHYKWRGWKEDEKIREQNVFKGKQIGQILDWIGESGDEDF